jgi:hypothetical protein
MTLVTGCLHRLTREAEENPITFSRIFFDRQMTTISWGWILGQGAIIRASYRRVSQAKREAMIPAFMDEKNDEA